MFSFFRQTFRQWARSGTRPAGAPKPPARRLQCEALEDRTLPSATTGEILVNAVKTGPQVQAVSATSSNGSSVVVWTTIKSGIDRDIKAQRFDANGNKTGSEILVAGGYSPQHNPVVSMDAYGNFAVAWTVDFSTTDTDIHAAFFNANGSRRGSEIVVADLPKRESDPSIGMAANGNFVVSYTYQFSSTDNDIKAVMYHSDGTVVKALDVAASSRSETCSRVGMAPDGRFDIVYVKSDDVIVNRYSSSGAVLGIHTVAGGTHQQREPAITMDKYGNAHLAWQENVNGNWGVFARALSSTGTLGNVVTVQQTSAQETLPSIAFDSSTGRYVVVYQSQTTGNPCVKVTELSGSSIVRTWIDGSSLADPFVSLGGSAHRFLVVAQSVGSRDGDSDGGIIARFGVL